MNYPKQILRNIRWSFDNNKFQSQTDFEEELIKYNEEITDETFTKVLSENALHSPEVVIQYSYWDDDEEDILEPDFLLRADNGSYFTIGELLFKVHNEVCERLKEDDHKFFESFDLWEGENPNNINSPLYFLQQGS
jgi:hypothetical protein